jgi:hypothetical protein
MKFHLPLDKILVNGLQDYLQMRGTSAVEVCGYRHVIENDVTKINYA